jgi:hypothetical protein
VNQAIGQSKNFMFWQGSPNLNNPVYYLPESNYLQFKDSIKIDSSYISDRGYFKVWFIENNNEVRFYRLSSPEGLSLGEAERFTRKLHIVSGASYGAMKPEANQIIDSLNKANALFTISPSIDNKFQYVLQTDAFFKNFKIDSSLSKSGIDSMAYHDYYKPFTQKFHELFPEINTEQISFFWIWDEMVTLTIRLESKAFDIAKLNELNVYFRNTPTVRKEIFRISVFQEALE